jgi:hypothetical protein
VVRLAQAGDDDVTSRDQSLTLANVTPKVLDDVLAQMQDVGDVEAVEDRTGGRPSVRIFLAG